MKTFQVGETVVIYVEVKKSAALYTPVPDSGNAVECDIIDPDGTVDTDDQALTEEATGKFSYSFASAGKAAGVWRVRFKATDGSKVSIKDSSFKLES